MEQFLGPVGAPGRLGVSYVEVRPTKASYGVYVHTVEDVGHEGFFDLVEFPPFDADQDEGESADSLPRPRTHLPHWRLPRGPRAQCVGVGSTRAWSRTIRATSFEQAGLRTNLPMDSPGQVAEHAADMPQQ